MDETTNRSERRYAFGDSEPAAERLGMLAQLFEKPSGSLLEELPPVQRGLVLDLGCGPGYSTALLGEVLGPDRLVGLDLSEAFLARARSTGGGADWVRHDVTVVPFPVGPADIVYARLVLAHLNGPEEVIRRWLDQVGPGGLLVLEEDHDILTEDPSMSRYEAMAAELVSARGGNLYVGRRLADFDFGEARLALNRIYDHVVPGPQAARLFLMNLRVWRHDPLVVERHPVDQLDRLERQLAMVAQGSSGGDVLFRIRQVVLRRP